MNELKIEYNKILNLLDAYLDKALGNLTIQEYKHIQNSKIRSDNIIKQLLDSGYRATTSEIIHGFKEVENDAI